MKFSEAISIGYSVPGARQSKAVWFCKWNDDGSEFCMCPSQAALVGADSFLQSNTYIKLLEHERAYTDSMFVELPRRLQLAGVGFTPFQYTDSWGYLWNITSLIRLIELIVHLNDKQDMAWGQIVEILREVGN